MILTVDIGNSDVVLGIFKDSEILQSWRLHTDIHQSVDEYEMLVRGMLFACDFSLEEVQGAVLSSVVPELTDVFFSLIDNLIAQPPIKVSHELNFGIEINTEVPARVGQDRLINALAAYQQYNTSLIIVDCGTATTFDVVIKKDYKGGVIAPGIKISLNTLSDKATLIPKINLKKINKVVGIDTRTAVRSGFFWGYAGLIDNIVNLIKKETVKSFKLVITGGFSDLFKGSIKTKLIQNKNITIKGLIKISKLIK